MIDFEWDKAKAQSNLTKHGISFDEAKTVFNDEFARVVFDESHSNNENRFAILGMSERMRILVVVHCFGQNNGNIRIISARKATKNEQKQYEEFLWKKNMIFPNPYFETLSMQNSTAKKVQKNKFQSI